MRNRSAKRTFRWQEPSNVIRTHRHKTATRNRSVRLSIQGKVPEQGTEAELGTGSGNGAPPLTQNRSRRRDTAENRSGKTARIGKTDQQLEKTPPTTKNSTGSGTGSETEHPTDPKRSITISDLRRRNEQEWRWAEPEEGRQVVRSLKLIAPPLMEVTWWR